MAQEGLLKQTNKSYLIEYLLDRIYKLDKNNIISITGETGSGKSFSALSLAETLSPDRFNINYVIFEPQEFSDLIKSQVLQKGDVIVWDEAGVGIPSKLWWSILNRSINYILQVFRNENISLIFTTPNLGFIDSDARKLLHFYFSMLRIDSKKKIAYIKPLRKKTIQIRDKSTIYAMYIRTPNNIKITKFGLKMPSKDLLRDYLKKKRLYQARLYSGLNEDIKRFNILRKSMPTKEEIIIYNKYKLGKTQEELAREYKTYPMKINRILNKCKNYFLE